MDGYTYLLLYLVLSLKQTSCMIKFVDPTLYEGTSCHLKDGRDGVCSSSCEDPEVQRDLSSICSFHRHKPIICCPKATPLKTYPILERLCSKQSGIEEEKRTERREAFERCKISFCPPTTIPTRPTTPRTPPRPTYLPPARTPSTQNENTHMAVLGWQTPENLTDWRCGGSLIHPSFVLTAAHCVDVMGQPDVVRVGGVNLQDDEHNYFVVDFDVVTSYIHPQYRQSEYYNDLALLEVQRTESHRSRPIPNIACLWLKSDFPEEKMLAMGYGAPDFGKSFTYKLYQNNLTVIETDVCKKYYTDTEVLPKGLIDSIICAHDPGGLADTCDGDSGGPLVYKKKDWMKTTYVIAVIAFGKICRNGDPGAYTRVHPYLGWIEEILSQNVST